MTQNQELTALRRIATRAVALVDQVVPDDDEFTKRVPPEIRRQRCELANEVTIQEEVSDRIRTAGYQD